VGFGLPAQQPGQSVSVFAGIALRHSRSRSLRALLFSFERPDSRPGP
jgi:hypothetical protein